MLIMIYAFIGKIVRFGMNKLNMFQDNQNAQTSLMAQMAQTALMAQTIPVVRKSWKEFHLNQFQ